MPTIPIDDLLRFVIEEEASDLHLSVGVPPTLRLKGVLTPLNISPLTAADMETLARGLARPDQMEKVAASILASASAITTASASAFTASAAISPPPSACCRSS
jgi:Tfp pilus assembly pilus retraction ATPase PilT